MELKGLRFTVRRVTRKRIHEMLVEFPPAPVFNEEEEEGL